MVMMGRGSVTVIEDSCPPWLRGPFAVESTLLSQEPAFTHWGASGSPQHRGIL